MTMRLNTIVRPAALKLALQLVAEEAEGSGEDPVEGTVGGDNVGNSEGEDSGEEEEGACGAKEVDCCGD